MEVKRKTLSALFIIGSLMMMGCSSKPEEPAPASSQAVQASSQNESKADSDAVQKLEVKNFGYYVSGDTSIQYAAEVYNPSANAVAVMHFDFTGKTKDGADPFENASFMTRTPVIAPNSTIYLSSGVIDVAGANEIEEAELRIQSVDWTGSTFSGELYKFDNVEHRIDDEGDLYVTGEITLLSDEKEIGPGNPALPTFGAVVKDANGKLLSGSVQYTFDEDLVVNEPTEIEVRVHNYPQDFASVELYAYPTMSTGQ